LSKGAAKPYFGAIDQAFTAHAGVLVFAGASKQKDTQDIVPEIPLLETPLPET
jgi:hypothetical protein